MTANRHRLVWHYAVAMLTVAVAAATRFALDPVLGDAIPVVIFTIPVAISAAFGGFGPAIFATVISTFAAAYLFIPPYYSLRIDNSVSIGILVTFVTIGIMLSLIGRRLHQLKRQAEEQSRQLQAQLARKDEFLATLAHELRNPLAGISAAGQLLKFAYNDKERLTAVREVILRQVSHMTELVDDLIDISRLAQGLVVIDPQPVDLRDVVRNALDQTQAQIEQRRHHLKITLSQEAALVNGDSTRLIQVIANLLGNAAKYTPEGGGVQLSICINEGNIDVVVSDTGIGIDAGLLPHIFEPFVQAERQSERSKGGLGLGLAVVQKVATLHGGTISVASAGLGAGSTFTLTLPRLYKSSCTGNAIPG